MNYRILERRSRFLVVALVLSMTACSGNSDTGVSSGSGGGQNSGATGTITANFNGEQRSWQVSADGFDQGYYRGSRAERNGADAVIVYLVGRPAAGSDGDNAQSLFLSFNVNDFRGSPSVPENDGTRQITYLTTSLMESHSSVNSGDSAFTVTEAETGGGMLQISGTFDGTINFKAMNRYASEDDPGPIEVTNGTFQATVPMEGFD